MSTPLTVFMTAQASATLATSNQLYIVSGAPANTVVYNTIGAFVTGWGELTSQQLGSWASSGAIGLPTGNGWILDPSIQSLVGQEILSGNWTASIRINASQFPPFTQAGLLTADIAMRVFRRTSAGVYFQIVSLVLTGQIISNAFTTYALPATAGGLEEFHTGDVLYIDVWLNVTSNNNVSLLQGIRLNRQSTDTVGLTGDPTVSMTSPGFQVIPAPTAPAPIPSQRRNIQLGRIA